MCNSEKWAGLIGAPEWEECPNPSTRNLYFVPEYLRGEAKAAHTTSGYAETIEVCDTCAALIRRMCEEDEDGEWGTWAWLDEEPKGK